MVNEDYFEDFNRRRPRRSTYRGSYRRPGSSQFFDPSADILAGIESVERTIGQRKKTVRDFENAAAIRRQEMIQSLQDTEAMDDMSAVDSLQASLMQQVDDLYKLDIESFEGDRSAYLKKANEVNRIVQTIPALMGLIDAEATTLDEAKKSGKPLDKSVLRSNNPDYYNFVENASKGGKNISFRIQNGNIIAQLDGKDVFNGNAYVKAKEKGVDLINYAKDYTKQMDEFDAEASKGLQSLVKASKIERAYDGGAVIRTEEKKDYIDAIKAYKKALEDDPNFGALINESTYQTFANDQSFYTRSNKQVKETKDAMINYMVGQKFKMYNPENDTAFGDIKVTRDVRSIKKGEEDSSRSYDKWISENITKKTKQTRYHDSPKEVTAMFDIPLPEKRKKVLEKIRSFNKVDLVYGSDDRVADAKGSEADPNKLYQLVKVPGAGSFNAFEVTVSDEDVLNDKALNKLLIDYDVKFNKSSVL